MDWLAAFASKDEQRAEAAVMSLAEGGERSLAVLTALLQDPDEEVRWWAVRTLGEIELPGVGELLVEPLHDDDNEVRLCAAVALRHRPSTAAIPTLLGLMENEDPLMARLAGDALIAAGPLAVPGLVEVAGRGRHASRLFAALLKLVIPVQSQRFLRL